MDTSPKDLVDRRGHLRSLEMDDLFDIDLRNGVTLTSAPDDEHRHDRKGQRYGDLEDVP